MKSQSQVDKEFDEKYPFEERFSGDYLEGLNLLKADIKSFIANQRKEDLESVVEALNPLLEKYVGDNVGENCTCERCDDNRKEFIKTLLQSLNK